MRYSSIIPTSIVDGTGVRVSLFISGCTHHCNCCHNPQTWDFEYGNEFTPETLEEVVQLLDKPYIKGLTLTGGDPLCSYADVLELTRSIKRRLRAKDIWLYTGYRMQTVKERFGGILDNVDVVVDGRFVKELADATLAFRGSSNQTIWEKNADGEFVRSPLNNR